MLIPIGDDNTKLKAFHPATALLIFVNVAIYLYGVLTQQDFSMAYGLIPQEITRFQDLVGMTNIMYEGQLQQIYQEPGPSPIFLTIISSMFLHGGFLHLAGNMLYLWIFGDNIDDYLGSFKFLIFYALCGLGAAFFQVISDLNSYIPMVGASGAISGVMGAYLFLFPSNKIRVALLIFIQFSVPSFVVLGLWIVMQLQNGLGGAQDNVAYMAHIGGFLVGAWWGWQERKKRKNVALF